MEIPKTGSIKYLKGKLLAYVVEVEGERREIPAEDVSVYTGDPYTRAELSFKYDAETNSCIDFIPLE